MYPWGQYFKTYVFEFRENIKIVILRKYLPNYKNYENVFVLTRENHKFLISHTFDF